jgi:hypothetical protein
MPLARRPAGEAHVKIRSRRAAAAALVSLASFASAASMIAAPGCNAVTGADGLTVAAPREARAKDATDPAPPAVSTRDAASDGADRPPSREGTDASTLAPTAECDGRSDCSIRDEEVCCLVAPGVSACLPALACIGNSVVLCQDDTDCDGTQSCIAAPGGYGVCR